MAKYTIELYKLIESENFELFDFNYELYDRRQSHAKGGRNS